MININYTIEKTSDGIVLVNQNTKSVDYTVVDVNPDKDYLEVEPRSRVNIKQFPFNRIDNIDTESLKDYFPHRYI
jgi:hypothetical protein